jgi:hypothetical protein
MKNTNKERTSLYNITILSIVIVFFNVICSNDILTAQTKKSMKYNQKSDEYEEWMRKSKSLKKRSESYRNLVRKGKHTGNLIETGFLNNGLLSDGYFGTNSPFIWPKGTGIEYGFVLVFYAAAEVVDASGRITYIISESFNRGGGDVSTDGTHKYFWNPLPGYFNDGEYSGGISEDLNHNGKLDEGEDYNQNGSLDLELVNKIAYPAMSHQPQTWPSYWVPQSYPGDDRLSGENRHGVRAGRWNGEFGAYVRADQESYYVMDDRDNDEFPYYPFNLPDGSPDKRAWPDGRRGLGLEVEVRNYQWNHPLAEDILISTYDIKNVSTKTLPRVIVGMNADIDVGGRASGNLANFDTVDDITYQWHKEGISQQGLPSGYFGFAFLQSPGNVKNKIDDDEDGIIDESQANGIDEDGDWRTFIDENESGKYEWEDLNYNGQLDTELDESMDGVDYNFDGDQEDILNEDNWHPLYSYENGVLDVEDIFDDVGSDGLGPEDEYYIGIDPDGSEANGIPDLGEPNFETTDNDEIDQIGLTSAYIKAVNSDILNDELFWKTELIPGTFITPEATQDIAFTYGSGYVEMLSHQTERFAIATLCGNDFDDILRNKRTMQEIYDADYNFAKPPRRPYLTAIPGDRRVTLIWDDGAELSRDPIYGKDFAMYKVYKSTDPHWNEIKTITDAFGNPVLWEAVAQFDLIDGLTGAHPVNLGNLGVAYDMGKDTGLKHSYIDTLVENGRAYYYAVTSVDKGYAPEFYGLGIVDKPNLLSISPTECSKVIQTDPLDRPIFFDRNCAAAVPSEPAAGYISPRIENGVISLNGNATGNISVDIVRPDQIKSDHLYQLRFSDDASFETFDVSYKTGFTAGFVMLDMTSGDTLHKGDSNFTSPVLEMAIIDGMKLNIINDEKVEIKSEGWKDGFSNLVTKIDGWADNLKAVPLDIEIEIGELGIDTSYSLIPGDEIATNFKVWDVTDISDKKSVPFVFTENDSLTTLETKGQLSVGDIVELRAGPISFPLGNDTLIVYSASTWRIHFDLPTTVENIADAINPKSGDVYQFTTTKPFDRNDIYEFQVVGNNFDQDEAKRKLANIYVVPDPYVAVSTLESQLSRLSGRGERRIDFVNLPPTCIIKIFTMSGNLVKVIEHEGTNTEGRHSWNMITKDGLEVSYGVYIYHVEVPGVGQKIGRFAIIK